MAQNTCCGNDPGPNTGKNLSSLKNKSIVLWKDTPAGKIPIVSAKLSLGDRLGGWRVRWRFNRDNYRVRPGLYGVGEPDKTSPVFVSANYKFSFDALRKELSDIDAWVLVIDTKGINVWCAAGKGTFGTKELIARIINHNLAGLVSHRNVILPQLGAVGVSAHKVTSFTKFKVIYGPVKAEDIPAFLKNNYKKTEEMKLVPFGWKDRLIIVPAELVESFLPALAVLAVISIFYFIQRHSLNPDIMKSLVPFIGSIITGAALVPLFLPFIPGRSFAWKGFLIGLLWALISILIYSRSLVYSLFLLLTLPPISSFIALNFTGATTFTSQTGVKKEMRYAIPYYIVSIGLGLIVKTVSLFIPNI